jgi:hypothetical protein
MSKAEYIEKYGYISNSDFKLASSQVRDLGIAIQDWKLEPWQKLTKKNIAAMIRLRLHLKHNCRKDFSTNFWNMYVLPKSKGICVVNYTGHSLSYLNDRFRGDYRFCISKNLKPINVVGEDLYYIPGSYPIYSVTSCLEEDIARVLATNPGWWTKEVIPIKIIPYF